MPSVEFRTAVAALVFIVAGVVLMNCKPASGFSVTLTVYCLPTSKVPLEVSSVLGILGVTAILINMRCCLLFCLDKCAEKIRVFSRT